MKNQPLEVDEQRVRARDMTRDMTNENEWDEGRVRTEPLMSATAGGFRSTASPTTTTQQHQQLQLRSLGGGGGSPEAEVAAYHYQTSNSRTFTLDNHRTPGVAAMAPRRRGGPITFVHSPDYRMAAQAMKVF